MRERPILFSSPMVRAILAGTKTQTRRVVKPQPEHPQFAKRHTLTTDDEGIYLYMCSSTLYSAIRCPYGKPGDRLWVRENGWERPDRTPKMMREGADTWKPYYYDADGYNNDVDRDQFKAWGFRRRPSIHMPRWASRILLEIVSVRVERLQDISEADAMAEGIMSSPRPWKVGAWWSGAEGQASPTPRGAYALLWESINGSSSWNANPWVWVVEFKVLP